MAIYERMAQQLGKGCKLPQDDETTQLFCEYITDKDDEKWVLNEEKHELGEQSNEDKRGECSKQKKG